MTIKKALWLFLSLILVFPLIILGSTKSSLAQEKPVNLTLVSAWSPGVKAFVVGALHWIEELERISGGKVKVKFIGGSEAIPVPEQFKSLKAGFVDIVFSTPLITASDTPILYLTQIVPLAKQKEFFTTPKVYSIIDSLTSRYGIKYIGDPHIGLMMYVWTNKLPPLDKEGKVKSLEGLRIRGLGPIHASMELKPLGATPVSIAGAELYEALKTGIVDGACTHPGGIYDGRYHEVLKYAIVPADYRTYGWAGATATLWMNMDVWKGLSPTVQKWILEANRIATEKTYDWNIAYHKEKLKYFTDEKILERLVPSAQQIQISEQNRMNILQHFTDMIEKEGIMRKEEILKEFKPYFPVS